MCVATLKKRRCTDECGRISTGRLNVSESNSDNELFDDDGATRMMNEDLGKEKCNRCVLTNGGE